MKNKNRFYFFLAIILLFAGGFWYTQKVFAGQINTQNIFSPSVHPLTEFQKQIIAKFRTGDVGGLAEYFNEEVSLAILQEEDYYSKEESEEILSTFCQNHKPKKFFVKHHGANEKQTSFYLIGELTTTTNKQFRVFISNNETQIELIRITAPLELQ